MQRPPRIIKWLAFSATSALVLKLCFDNLFHILSPTKNRYMMSSSNEFDQNPLTQWALSGERKRQTNGEVNDEIKQRDDLKLIGAQIFFRHGARTPLNLLPGLEEVMTCLFFIIFSRILPYLVSVYRSEFIVTYTKKHFESYAPSKWDVKLKTELGDKTLSAKAFLGDRIRALKAADGGTVVSGQLTAIGEEQLYTLGQSMKPDFIASELIPPVYDPNITYCRATYMDRTIASARSFLAGLFSDENQKVQAKGPFEIECHSFPYETLFPNPRVYPILEKCHNATSLYESLHDDHELKKARNAVLKHIGAFDYKHGIVELSDDIISRKAHGFSVPEDLLTLTKDFESYAAREYVIMAPYYKLYIYSGHDSTLIPLAMALDVFDMKWPRYASHIVMKYYSSIADPSDTYVLVNFSGQPQKLPNCDTYYCPYSTLLNNLQNRIDVPKTVN
ncbi:unnamed protein product [Didymodactylos carnosus]|uniref:2-phosphoxylose phosphatase 1 n=1 Tax=Didymodactylos carnosus TaxID=1234261 RepID=A0A813NLA9_9BILA|nr:unnamed protein product [Didymodactylos carnosus]CAF3519825.1 unnamed protein product [Didymodactylos carnosus]